eukprot:5304531-Pyramimonas_sp.AAC.1
MQTGQNFHAHALARAMGIAPPPTHGGTVPDALAEAQTIQQAQQAVLAGLPLPSAGPLTSRGRRQRACRWTLPRSRQ